MSASRLPAGGLIDRARPCRFTFEGRHFEGFAGDTLASALLAGGVSVVGRSFKLHRPRGLMAAGVEETNAIMQLGQGARAEANPRATEIEPYDGLVARAVNRWPSVRRDVGAINDTLGRFIPAGFYYKTFMWPGWKYFEPAIRRAAGLGTPSREPDPDTYDNRFAHCDVLVVGAGPAGLAAALAAGRDGARVILCEQDFLLGGSLLWDAGTVDGDAGAAWARRATETLAARPETRVLTRTAAVGYFDHNMLALVERVTDHLGPAAPRGQPRQRLWQVRTRRVVLATGALERPLVFPGNDRPGVMLAAAVRQYLRRWAVRAGERAVVFTNNDGAYATAHALRDAGATVTVVDPRRDTPARDAAQDATKTAGIAVVRGEVVATRGRMALEAVRVRGEAERWIDADLLAMSGGLNPTVQLFRQSGGRLEWDDSLCLFRPGESAQAERSVGAAAGTSGLAAALRDGHAAGEEAARLAGRPVAPTPAPVAAEDATPAPLLPLWSVNAPGKAFVDFQNDVSTADIALAARENFVSVEHLKRYTTLGMATDQGKTSNVNALAVMASMSDRAIPLVGTTLYRFPFTPTTMATLAGRSRGALFRPFRRLPAHAAHAALDAVYEEYGGWMRPAWYRRGAETAHQAEQREARGARLGAALFDASPLGKIEVVGRDAASFLDRVYANTMSTLKVGHARYGLMLNELGVVIDDGVTLRLAEDRFLVGTTSGGAARIAAWLEEWLQCEWPHLDVLTAPVTTARGVLTLSGPRARAVLAAAGTGIDLAPYAFPHMTFRDGTVAGIPARVARVSFTGDLSYEISVPATRTETLWRHLLAVGADEGILPVGIDAWMLLRTEKGYLHVGADTDGTTAPDDIGWAHVLRRKTDFIGRRSLIRPDNLRPDRFQFVGLDMLDPKPGRFLAIGAHLRAAGARDGSEGYVTSAGYSPTLGRGVALGMVRGGRTRHGETVDVLAPDGTARARITPPGAFDPAGEKLRA